ncbi:6307_t:CDS:1, partial [Ambispora leptoticha]
KNFLIDLLNLNDLEMPEIEIWDSLVKWGIAQMEDGPLTERLRTGIAKIRRSCARLHTTYPLFPNSK